MSSGKPKSADPVQCISAGERYRAAFERLKSNKPERLPKGSSVSQNNVAKEAGSDPSALKKSRFPLLVAEIQKYVEEHGKERPPSVRQVSLLARKKLWTSRADRGNFATARPPRQPAQRNQRNDS